VRYPFGHGLSYTTFETSGLAVRVRNEQPVVDVIVTVTNSGMRRGRHLVQVYVATSAGPVRRPARELRAFTQVELDAGQSRTVTLELDRRAFAYWDVNDSDWAVAAGEYTIQIGHSATDIVAEQTVELAPNAHSVPLTAESTVAEWFTHPKAGPRMQSRIMAIVGADQPTVDDGADPGIDMALAFAMIGPMPMRQFARFPFMWIPLETLEAEAALANEGAG
jgi:beta-glucosidase